jgi:hypothetical protein
VASLPRGAVGKGVFAVGFWQLRSATLGKIFLALPSVVARGAWQRNFYKKIKNRHCRRPLPRALGTRFFFQKNRKTSLPTAFARGARHRVSFQKKIKNPLFADGPASRPSAKKVSKNRQPNPPLTATFFGRQPTVGSRHSLCREPRAQVLGKEPWLRKNSP